MFVKNQATFNKLMKLSQHGNLIIGDTFENGINKLSVN